jgi:hypothetical protein
MTSISFEVGAVFLLAAMLLYGSLSGFLPRALHAGKAAPIGIGCCLLAYALYRTVPELPNLWRDADSRPAPQISSPGPAIPPAAGPKRGRAAAPTTPRQQSWKTTTVGDSIPPPQPAAEPADPSADPSPVPPAPSSSEPASPDDPYDSGIKRGIKRVGRFLHIGGKNNRP